MRRVWLAWIGVVCLMVLVAVLWRARGRTVSVERVAGRLASAERSVRLETAQSLGKVRAPNTVPALLTRLEVESDAEVRAALYVAVAQAATPEGDAAVRVRMAAPDPATRLEVVNAFVGVPVFGAVAMLAERLPAEPDRGVRDAICFALGKAGTHAAATALAMAVDDPDPEIAQRARRVLEALYRNPLPPDAQAARAYVRQTVPPGSGSSAP